MVRSNVSRAQSDVFGYPKELQGGIITDTRKVTLVATIAIIALLAVGVGYAYTATTSNSGNEASPEFITVVQGGTGGYQFSNDTSVYWDSDDSRSGMGTAADPYVYTTEFTLSDNVISQEIGNKSYKLVRLGNPITLITEQTGGTVADVSCSVANTGTWAIFDGTNVDTTFFLKVVNNTTTTYLKYDATSNAFKTLTDADATFTIAKNGSAFYDTTVEVYYAYETDANSTGVKVTHALGVNPEGPATSPLTAAGLSFTVSNNGSNNPVVTALAASKANMQIVAGSTDSAYVAFTPSNAADQRFTAVSSDTEKATVSVSNNMVTVTGVAAGNVTITITSTAVTTATTTISVTVTAAPEPGN